VLDLRLVVRRGGDLIRRFGIALAILTIAGASAAGAQDSSTFSLGLSSGLGGSLDERGADIDHSTVQLSAGMLTAARTWTVIRLGRLGVDDSESIGGLAGADLEYASIAGEYRFRQPTYDFGLSLGLGYYRLEGDVGSVREKEEALGLVLGLGGTFDVTRHLAVTAEVDFHYAFLDDANLYGIALVGVAVQF